VDLEALDDRALVSQTQSGNRDAFSVLVVRYQARVLNLLYRRLGDRETALDVAQEAFLKAYRGLPRFQGEAQFFTWLYRIALNEASNAHRRRERQPRVEADAPDGDRLPDPHDSGAALERRDDSRLIQQAMVELGDEYAQAVILRDLDGMSYQEIAEVLQVPLGSVKSRIHRARQTLRNRLTQAIGPQG
jgi:RNA polymerase sigma-70 factor (ECF subfamily)